MLHEFTQLELKSQIEQDVLRYSVSRDAEMLDAQAVSAQQGADKLCWQDGKMTLGVGVQNWGFKGLSALAIFSF